MSYQIVYGSENMPSICQEKKRRHTGLALCVLGILMLGILRISGWGNALLQHLIPGDPVITTEAFQNMSTCLKSGQSLSEAVFVFCDTIIQGTKLG